MLKFVYVTNNNELLLYKYINYPYFLSKVYTKVSCGKNFIAIILMPSNTVFKNINTYQLREVKLQEEGQALC